jgi:hypothetical protein
MATSEIKLATFQLVAQCLNQLRQSEQKRIEKALL